MGGVFLDVKSESCEPIALPKAEVQSSHESIPSPQVIMSLILFLITLHTQ